MINGTRHTSKNLRTTHFSRIFKIYDLRGHQSGVVKQWQMGPATETMKRQKFDIENTPLISKRTTLLRIDVQCEERRRRARRSAASRNGHSDSNAARSSAAELDVTTFPNTSRPSDGILAERHWAGQRSQQSWSAFIYCITCFRNTFSSCVSNRVLFYG